jgi:hypothetical protein
MDKFQVMQHFTILDILKKYFIISRATKRRIDLFLKGKGLRTADQNREKVGCKNLDFDQGDQISL